MTLPFFGPEAWRPMAMALKAFVMGDEEAILTVHSDEGEPDPMPVALFFRPSPGFREVDRVALDLARGRVLDVGAGVGSIALALQAEGKKVTAVEVIPEAAEIMRSRGVEDVRLGRVQDLSSLGAFDTILLLMNGAALAGTLAGLQPLLECLVSLMAPGGQILLDSTDLLAGNHEAVVPGLGVEGDYPGELQFQLEFRGERGAPFPQLFVDPRTLSEVARQGGWKTETVWKGSSGEYLARLVRRVVADSGRT